MVRSYPLDDDHALNQVVEAQGRKETLLLWRRLNLALVRIRKEPINLSRDVMNHLLTGFLALDTAVDDKRFL